jgi:asparagine synthase (glutamine-hydrolysing)
MCGIAGFTHRSRSADDCAIRGITSALTHRGPDQQDVYHSPAVSLGAVRLKIIDLAGGDQPISSEDGDTVIAFNGEIYNHRELRHELEGRGRRFRSRCDTEVVLQAFLEWDVASFARLRGMFAVALWTESQRRLVLARDRAGIKPLYYARLGDDLYFGSELKAILGHAEIPREIDLDGVGHFLSLNYVPGPRTLVRSIKKLMPGRWLEWRDGSTRSEPYWRLDLRPDAAWTLESAKTELDTLLRSSVREHLVSDVPLGIWLSGGIDSSTILHYASEETSQRLKTFSVSFAGRSFDESRYFREVAARYGTEHHEFDLNPDVELAGAIHEFAWYSDEPSADAGALPVWYLSRMSRRHVTVALSGEGADELFGGYVTYLADRYARWSRRTPAFLRRALIHAANRLWPVSDDKISLEYKLKRFLEGSLLSPDESHFFWNGACSPGQRTAICPACARHGIAALTPETPGLDPLSHYLYIDQLYYLPDDILYKTDRMSMAHSLEVRPPFLDHRIIEFAATLPPSLKIRGGCLKYLLKALMRDKLPPSVIRRKKTGFDIPTHHWFRGPLRSLLLDTLRPEAVERTGLFDSRAVARMIGDHMERRANHGYQLWGLLTLFLWIAKWKIQTAPLVEPPVERAFTTN